MSAGLPPVRTFGAGFDGAETSACRELTASALASGPTSVLASNGSPSFSFSIWATNSRLKLIRDLIGDDETLGSDAGLPVVERARP